MCPSITSYSRAIRAGSRPSAAGSELGRAETGTAWTASVIIALLLCIPCSLVLTRVRPRWRSERGRLPPPAGPTYPSPRGGYPGGYPRADHGRRLVGPLLAVSPPESGTSEPAPPGASRRYSTRRPVSEQAEHPP